MGRVGKICTSQTSKKVTSDIKVIYSPDTLALVVKWLAPDTGIRAEKGKSKVIVALMSLTRCIWGGIVQWEDHKQGQQLKFHRLSFS
jgi:hypothetical protein